MKRPLLISIACVLAFLMASVADAPAQGVCGVSGELVPVNDEALTVSSVAIGFTASKYNPGGSLNQARVAILSTETDSLRYRVNGSNPTSSVGHLVPAGSSAVVCGYTAIEQFKAIRVSTDVAVYATFYRRR